MKRGKSRRLSPESREESFKSGEDILAGSSGFQEMFAAMDEDIARGNYRSFRQYLREKNSAA